MRHELSDRWSDWIELAYAAMRIVAGFLFLIHGAQKLLGWAGGQQVALGTLLGTAGVIEIVAGLLILLGLFTTVAAFIASGEMAVAYFLMHSPQGGLPIQNGGELAVLYCFVFLYIAARGDGRWSVAELAGLNRPRRPYLPA
jgi:putative oxidoreductase